jgi:hypothetical protein
MSFPSPPLTPPLKPQLRVDIPSWTVSLAAPSYSPPSASSLTPWSPPDSPVSASTRSLLMYTIGMLPDHVLSPSSWKLYAFDPTKSSPLTLFYFVPETNVTVQITGYANGQYVVRLLGQQISLVENKEVRYDLPLVAVSICGSPGDGERQDVPAWKVRETLMERIEWDKELE